MKTYSKTRILVEGALMIALATVLSTISLFSPPQGGTITLEMIPLVLMSFRHDTKWGVFTAFVHGVLQMILGFSNVLYCTTLLSQIACILLDYILAFTALGLASWFAKLLPNKMGGVAFGSFVVCMLRYLCSFISGICIWGGYAPEGTPVWQYSLVYNGSYMIPDAILTVAVAVLLYKFAPQLFQAQESATAKEPQQV